MGRAGIFIFILAIMIISPVFADDGADKTVQGTITAIDWVSSNVSVRYADPYSGNMDEIILRVTGDSELTRGTDSISLSDIEQGDPIEVTYYREDLSGLKIRRLSDMNDANR